MRISSVESLRIPEEGSSAQGKSGPKPRAEAVGDGQPVDIPYHRRLFDEAVTQKDRRSRLMGMPVQAVRLISSEVR